MRAESEEDLIYKRRMFIILFGVGSNIFLYWYLKRMKLRAKVG